MEWHKVMSVGVAEFDDDHKRVIVLLTEIQEALRSRKVARASELTAELMTVAAAHAEREEKFLRTSGYPGVEEVVAAQRDSLNHIAELAKMFETDTPAADDAVLEMRLNFIDYLLRADINYRTYVRSVGLSDC